MRRGKVPQTAQPHEYQNNYELAELEFVMDTFGRKFRVSVFGESHGPAVGAVLDGVPAGISLSEEDFMEDIDRRRSGARGTTPRREADLPEILSGVFDGHTTGAPLAIIFRNTNTKSQDYSRFMDVPRPGHADFVAMKKWSGANDPRGGGHFSGRLTLPLVAAGVVAKKIVGTAIDINARLIEIGGVTEMAAIARRYNNEGASGAFPPDGMHGLDGGGKDPVPDTVNSAVGNRGMDPSELWRPELDQAIAEGDSLGGVVECVITGLPAGLGEPFFDSVESLVAHAVFSVPGVRGIEFGHGFPAARMKGSQHNDPFILSDGKCSSNGAGGINGGITNGNPMVFRVAFKPTSSIGKPQSTLDFSTGKMTELVIPGRHDVCFAIRTPVVVEAAAAIVLADLV